MDLTLYLPGLSSTLSFASLSVRTPFLALLETHLLKVDPEALRPALKSIILMLLPGLEEETSEDFERTLKILNGFRSVIQSGNKEEHSSYRESGDEYFWQCFFLASITSNNRRLGALAYLTRFLPKLGRHARRDSIASSTNGSSVSGVEQSSDHDATMVTSPEPGLLLRCFAAGLADEQILIQRGFLDLLVTHLPLHAKVLQTRVKPEDLELLMVAASGVVARRDMSLNRRLWSWLLGPEVAPSADNDGPESPSSVSVDPMTQIEASRTRYFEQNGLQPLTRALLKIIVKEQQTPVERAKPYRVCLSLMDRWEIGGLIVPEIFMPMVSSIQKYEKTAATKDEFQEALRSASVFFDGVESGLIWGEILGLLAEALGPSKISFVEKVEKLSLVRFILANFNVREEEMLVVHAPHTALAVLAMISESRGLTGSTSPSSVNNGQIMDLAVVVTQDIINLIPERAYSGRSSRVSGADQTTSNEDMDNTEVLQRIRNFYVNDQGNLDVADAPFPADAISQLTVREAGRLASQSLSGASSSADVAAKTRVLVLLLSKAPEAAGLEMQDFTVALRAMLSSSTPPSFSNLTSIVSLVANLYGRSYISLEDFSASIDPLVGFAWFYLSPSFPKYHVETARILWQLQASLPANNRNIEAAICNQMVKNEISGNVSKGNADPGRRFAILWTHIVLDNAVSSERRVSKSSNGDTQATPAALGLGPYEILLGRPLFLMLDALQDERTPLFVTVRTWIQSLAGIDKSVTSQSVEQL